MQRSDFSTWQTLIGYHTWSASRGGVLTCSGIAIPWFETQMIRIFGANFNLRSYRSRRYGPVKSQRKALVEASSETSPPQEPHAPAPDENPMHTIGEMISTGVFAENDASPFSPECYDLPLIVWKDPSLDPEADSQHESSATSDDEALTLPSEEATEDFIEVTFSDGTMVELPPGLGQKPRLIEGSGDSLDAVESSSDLALWKSSSPQPLSDAQALVKFLIPDEETTETAIDTSQSKESEEGSDESGSGSEEEGDDESDEDDEDEDDEDDEDSKVGGQQDEDEADKLGPSRSVPCLHCHKKAWDPREVTLQEPENAIIRHGTHSYGYRCRRCNRVSWISGTPQSFREVVVKSTQPTMNTAQFTCLLMLRAVGTYLHP